MAENVSVEHTRVISIVGPTASGKTDLAIEVARRHSGEIVCADSRTVYRGLDIGTAKPTAAERAEIPHHVLDVADPDESFSAAEFQRLATAAIRNIHRRERLPILVGGTGLYVDAVLYDYHFPSPADPKGRGELEQLTIVQLQQRAEEAGVELNASDYHNRRRLIRALETVGQPRTRGQLPTGVFIVGLRSETDQLKARIAKRVEGMLSDGLLDEVRTVGERYGYDCPGMSGIGYRAFAEVAQGGGNLKVATERFIAGDLNLAKRQLTWFKRNPDINWATDQSSALALIDHWVSQAL